VSQWRNGKALEGSGRSHSRYCLSICLKGLRIDSACIGLIWNRTPNQYRCISLIGNRW